MDFQTVLRLLPGFVIGLTIHEFSHAMVAYRLGDNTAADLGRLSLNPHKHLDLFGSLMLVFAGFGWAKPVPVDMSKLRHPRRDMVWVSLAGPFSNLLIALTVGSFLQLFFSNELQGALSGNSIVLTLLLHTVWINVILAVFNMIPLPPLDGSRIVEFFVPRRFYVHYFLLQRIGPMILLGLVFFSSVVGFPVFSRVLLPIAQPVFKFCLGGWDLI